MTAVICTDSEHLYSVCSAYFELAGYTVRREKLGRSVKADIVILDLPLWVTDLPAVDCSLLVIPLACNGLCPIESRFHLEPTDRYYMMDEIFGLLT